MLIDPYDRHWLGRYTDSTYLLIDGVFVPGLHRLVNAALPSSQAASLLFEKFPGCSDRTRDVSPFLVRYQPSNTRFQALLEKCSGWPMMCAIETTESQSELADRLAAWCIIEVDGQRFNFRFPDTRRLPAIFSALNAKQRAEFAGPATRWSYIARDGRWRELPVTGTPSAIADRPELDDQQFADLVRASEVDEVISQLAQQEGGRQSQRYAAVSLALHVAERSNLDGNSKVAWCETCLSGGLSQEEPQVAARLTQWLSLQPDSF